MVEVFPIVPASAKAVWFLGAVCALLALVVGALSYTAYASQRTRVEVSAQGLRIVGDFWGRRVAIGSLRLADARALRLADEPELSPRRRTFGTGLPGYLSGWFRLRNGEKALVYLTDSGRVAYIPTSEGYSLLLSVAEPERMLEELASRAAR